MSQASAILAPAPAAGPLTAQTTGFGSLRMARMSGLTPFSSDWPRSGRAWPGANARLERSAPAQKPLPAPVTSTARHWGSAAARAIPAASASMRAMLSAFRRSGRFRVSVSTPPSSWSKSTGSVETGVSAVTERSLIRRHAARASILGAALLSTLSHDLASTRSGAATRQLTMPLWPSAQGERSQMHFNDRRLNPAAGLANEAFPEVFYFRRFPFPIQSKALFC
jgi:hypothetical protein